MLKKIRWITETAVLLALLLTAQVLTKPFGQLVTGSFVNAILALTALYAGLSSGITVAVISPVMAWLLTIAPNPLTVPAIMVGNVVYVILLHFIVGRSSHILRKLIGWMAAAAAKFAVLYGIVNWLICGIFAGSLLESGLLKEPMLNTLPGMFSWPQLVTALIGGFVALGIAPTLRKALKK